MFSNAVLRKKLFRETLSGWKQFLAIILIGGIAVTLFVGLLSNAKSLSDRVDEFYAEGNSADIYVTTNSYSWVDKGQISSVLSHDDAMEERFEMTSVVDGALSYGAISPTMPAISGRVDDIAHSNEQTDENYFLLDKMLYKDFAPSSARHYDLGDKAKITYALGSFFNAAEASGLSSFVKSSGTNVLAEKEISISYSITGFMTTPENVAKSTYYSSTYLMSKKVFRAGFLSLLEANYTEDGVSLIEDAIGWGVEKNFKDPSSFPQVDQYLIKLKDHSTLDAKEKAIGSFFDAKGDKKNNLLAITDRSSNPWSIAVDTDVKESQQLTFVFPFVFFFVALLVILTTIGQIIIKERTQIGTMKALGLTKGEIYRHYVSLTLMLVGIGTAIGCILGPIIIPAIMAQKYDILYTLPARSFFVFPWWQALLTATIFLVSGALVTVLVCHKEISLTPAQSMRPSPVNFKSHRDLLPSRDNKPQSAIHLSVKMAFRNIRVNLVKSLMVVVGVLGCTALLVCGFGIEDTLDYGIKTDLALYYNGDISLSYPSPQASRLSDITSVDGVGKVEEFLVTASTLTYQPTDALSKTTYNSTVRFFPDDHEHFKVDFPKGTVAISTKVAEAMGVKMGDVIAFTYNGETLSNPIGAIYESFTVHGVSCRYSDFPSLEAKYDSAWVDIAPGWLNSSPANTLTNLEDTLASKSFVSHAESQIEMKKRVENVMSGVYIMTDAIKVFAVLLAVVVLYNLALLNFRERTRDIATLKVLGFSKLEIAMSLIVETMSLTTLGVFFGSLLGFPFMYLVLYVNQVNLVEFLYHVFPLTYLYAFLITFVLAYVVNLYLASLTGKVKMVESLKSVE